MTAGRRALALMAVGILSAAIWQASHLSPPPAVPVAGPVLNGETENARVPSPVVRAASRQVSPVRLVPFDACAPMLRHLRTRALPKVTAWGLNSYPTYLSDVVIAMPAMQAPPPAPGSGGGSGGASGGVVGGAAPAMPAPAAAADFSTTNVQEAGVDEPDLVKTDGKMLYSVANGRLYAVDVRGAQPKIIGSLGVSRSGPRILLAGDRVMVFSSEGPVGSGSGDLATQWHMAITIVDVSDPEKMYVIDRVRVEGSFVSARLVGGVARVVSKSTPAIAFPSHQVRNEQESAAAVRANKAVVRRAKTGQWLPNFALEHGGRTVAAGVAVPCDRVSRPLVFAGLGMTTVLSIDPRDPKPQDASTVNADVAHVYATAEHLYLAASRPDPQVSGGVSLMSTQIHKFDISQPGPARYLASGEVRGSILNQWSMSEHDGFLRVATTENEFATASQSQSFVIVMQQREGELVRISAVRGLGRSERIFGVRFMGTTGYVVTFRLIDPLYVIDLSKPWDPEVKGELKIPGYSAYLHPVGPGRLLGIGREATTEGRVIGVKASLFDVSDPTDPREIASLKLADAGMAGAEHDHQSFLWWPKTRLAFVPVSYSESVGIRVDDDSLTEIKRIGHVKHAKQQWEGAIERATVVRDALLTTSQAGLMTSELNDLAERAWVGWTD